jgi:hypothetical protein
MICTTEFLFIAGLANWSVKNKEIMDDNAHKYNANFSSKTQINPIINNKISSAVFTDSYISQE